METLVNVFDSIDELAEGMAKSVVMASLAAIKERGRFTIAVTSGQSIELLSKIITVSVITRILIFSAVSFSYSSSISSLSFCSSSFHPSLFDTPSPFLAPSLSSLPPPLFCPEIDR